MGLSKDVRVGRHIDTGRQGSMGGNGSIVGHFRGGTRHPSHGGMGGYVQ